jgi:hypothetical protein
MKAVARYLSLFAALVLASQALAVGAQFTSTCWLTCRTPSGGFVRYTEPGITESACCSGEALQCPPGDTEVLLAWGSPAEICSPE